MVYEPGAYPETPAHYKKSIAASSFELRFSLCHCWVPSSVLDFQVRAASSTTVPTKKLERHTYIHTFKSRSKLLLPLTPQKDSFRLLGQSFKDASVKQLKKHDLKSEPSSVIASLVCQSTFKHFPFWKSWDSFHFELTALLSRVWWHFVPLPCWRGADVERAISNQQSAHRN